MLGSSDPGQISRRHGGLIDYLAPLLDQRHSTLDHAQMAALERLQQLADDLAEFAAARKSALRRLFGNLEVPHGVYLHGGVGRGKSLLMDSFYATVAIRRKMRVHFHAFMRDVHAAMGCLTHEADPLAAVAAQVARRYRLVCLDEFHVDDIADAMILGRLLDGLFEQGVVLVVTSNYAPDDLWANGLLRERFLPAIATIKRRLDVVEVDAGVDYRLRALEHVEAFYVPSGAAADAAMSAAYERMRSSPEESTHLTVEARQLVAKRRAGSLVWFDFRTLCDAPRSQRDYLELARRFSVMFLSNVPQMGPDAADQARRFTWLVDILYDHRVKLVASAAVPAEALYVTGRNAGEFARTVSRLAEMRTRDYMALPHVTTDAAEVT
ncbi:MAG TPA: cell division protein ZapE [Casimicrobiaceae bacterium]|jgi:cell division protein ZapE|nr:cell division protein ZapE [Casimicrobiaceae bacterium]